MGGWFGTWENDDKRINGGDEDEKFAGRFCKRKKCKVGRCLENEKPKLNGDEFGGKHIVPNESRMEGRQNR